jgi:hypothetical protein
VNIFRFEDYRTLLRECLLEKKAQYGRLFTFEKMAKACRLQRTYLSTVMSGTGHLNSDQLFAACDFLQLRDDEYEFVSLLHEWERSQFPDRRKRLSKEIALRRQTGLKTDGFIGNTVATKETTPKHLDAFYLNILAQLVHMFLTIPRYAKEPESIRRALGLEKDSFRIALNTVEQAGLISISGKEIKILQSAIHLPASSHLYPNYRMQMRLKALDAMQSRSAENHYSFSVLFSASEKTRRHIHARFLDFISWCQKVSSEDVEENVFQMNFDLLKWD